MSSEALRPPADRMQLLDVSRVIAAVGVVGAHVADEFFPGNPVWILGTFAVPFYLFVAIYFTVRGLVTHPDRPLVGYLVGRFQKLYVPFLLWNVVYDLLHVLKHPADGFTSLALMPWAAVYTHLYFLPFLLVMTIALALATRPLHRAPIARRSTIVLLIVAASAIAFGPQPTQWRDPMNIRAETLWNVYRSLPLGLAACAFALAFGGSTRRLSFTPIVGVVGLVVLAACLAIQWRFDAHPVLRGLSGFGLLLAAFVPVAHVLLRPVAALGKLSFGVYLAHVAVIRVAVMIVEHADLKHTPAVAAATIAFALVGGFAFSAVVARSRWTRWAIGCESPESQPRPAAGASVSRQTRASLPEIDLPRISGPLLSEPR